MFGTHAAFSDSTAWHELKLMTGLNLPFFASPSTHDPLRGSQVVDFGELCVSTAAFTKLLEDRVMTEGLGQGFGLERLPACL